MVVPEIICLVQGYSACRIAKELPNATVAEKKKKSSSNFFGLKRKRYTVGVDGGAGGVSGGGLVREARSREGGDSVGGPPREQRNPTKKEGR